MSEARHWSRRGFLTARGLGACAGGLLGELLADAGVGPSEREQWISHVCFSRRAMACDFTLLLPPTLQGAWEQPPRAMQTPDEPLEGPPAPQRRH